ncbi:MAG: PAS domain S-box protein [Azospirillum sp.]|nr:PAS domain S-box protein [Azospirillum sp.]
MPLTALISAALLALVVAGAAWLWFTGRVVARRTANLLADNERLQQAVEEEEVANEELQIALGQLRTLSEELQAANEELQTTTEELRTTTDELQTTNVQLAAEVEEKTRYAEALRDSEERFRGAFETAPHGVALVSLRGRWLKVNRALCRSLGYSEAELLGLDIRGVTHPDDADLDRGQIDQLIAGEIASYLTEKRYLRKDGELRWVELSIGLVRNGGARPLHFVVHVHDITERRRIADEIEHTRQNLALAQEIAELGSWEWDADTEAYFWSEQCYRMLGLSSAEFVPSSDTLREHIHPDDQAGFEQQRLAGLRGECPYDFQLRMIRADGTIRTVRTRGELRRATDGRVVGAVGTVQDITDHKQSEERLAYQNLLLTVQQATSPDGILVIDKGGQIRSWNRRFLDIWHLKEEALGNGHGLKAIVEASHRLRDSERFVERFRYLLAYIDEEEDGSEIVFGDGRIFEQYSKGVIDRRRGFAGRVWFFRDITERKRFEDALQGAKEEAEYANRTKSEFLAMMSHELRTPLNAVIGFSDTIRLEVFGPVGSPKYSDYVNDIHESGLHLLELINDILDVSAIEAGKLQLQEEPLDIEKIAAAAFRLIRSRADKARIMLSARFDAKLPGLIADKRRLTQILLNLLSNGVKFTPPGGEVWVGARRLPHGGLELAVEDTGIGMDEAGIAKAMSMFGRVDNRLSREGTGLGLPLTKRLVEAHGGTLTLASQPNLGTTVTMTFPASRVVE